MRLSKKMVNDPDIVEASKNLIRGPRGGRRPDLNNAAYLKALEAKLSPQEIAILKNFLEKMWMRGDIPLRSSDVGNTKSFQSIQKYAAGDNISEGKKTKTKKESTESKLAEIEKQGRIVTMEAQIEALDELINSKTQRLSMISEDEDLSEIADKGKLKEMQREVKELQKRKMKMEKLYEKMCGKSYSKPEIVDEAADEYED